MKQSFVPQFIQLLKHQLYNVQLGVIIEKNCVLSVDQCQLQAFQFSVHLIDLLSILLRCNGFAGVQKADVIQMSSRPPVTMTFWGANLALGNALKFLLSPATELVFAGCHIASTFCHTSQFNGEMVHCCWVE